MERDSPFLNWRYYDSRGGEYVVRSVEEQGRLLGYCVTKPTRPRAWIADLIAQLSRPDVARAFVRDATPIASEGGAVTVDPIQLRGHPHTRVLLEEGFLPRDYPHILTMTNFTARQHAELRFLETRDARVHVAPGDFDHI